MGDSHVAERGFITFSFAIHNIAKCMKETAPPGQEREVAGKVSSSGRRRRVWGRRGRTGPPPHTERLSRVRVRAALRRAGEP